MLFRSRASRVPPCCCLSTRAILMSIHAYMYVGVFNIKDVPRDSNLSPKLAAGNRSVPELTLQLHSATVPVLLADRSPLALACLARPAAASDDDLPLDADADSDRSLLPLVVMSDDTLALHTSVPAAGSCEMTASYVGGTSPAGVSSPATRRAKSRFCSIVAMPGCWFADELRPIVEIVVGALPRALGTRGAPWLCPQPVVAPKDE